MQDNKQKEGRLTFRAWYVSQGGSHDGYDPRTAAVRCSQS